MATRPKKATMERDDLAERIVDAAIATAEEVGWDNVRLRLVAERLNIPLAEVGARFRDANAVADAWFARARQAMLAPQPPGFQELPGRERLEATLWQWFEATSAHRRVSVQMLAGKLWPFHPHHWVPMLFDLSRTVLWLRDAAGCDAQSPRREVEEVGLTWLLLATLAVWSRDDGEGQARTRQFLHDRLADADVLATLLFGPQSSSSDARRA
jgi:AcrR family transcriptional regulator